VGRAGRESAILKVANFQDSQIAGKMIHGMDDSIAVPFGGFASRLRRLSGPLKVQKNE
jgi:hypothetical protein